MESILEKRNWLLVEFNKACKDPTTPLIFIKNMAEMMSQCGYKFPRWRAHIVFTNACTEGNLELAKWIYDVYVKKGTPLKVDIGDIFVKCCEGNYFNVIEWLYSMFYTELNWYSG